MNNLAVLKRALVRESYCLLQYIPEACPWTSDEDQASADQLRHMVAAEKKAGRRIADFLSHRRVTPDSGSFPEAYTALHFLALDYLLPRLVRDQQRTIAALEQDAAGVTAEEARTVLQQLVEIKRRHLMELELLAAQHTGAKAVSTLR